MKKRISILLVVLWMLFIFNMSSYNSIDSNNQSGFIVNIISNILNINDLDTLSFIIRKIAHFTEYFILGLFTQNMIHNYNKKKYISIIICIFYAISDELHQSLIPGRSCQILDVIIDSIGSLLGIYLLHIFFKTKKFNKNSKEINIK